MSAARDERYDECVFKKALRLTVSYSRRIPGDTDGIEHRVALAHDRGADIFRHIERKGDGAEWTQEQVASLFEDAAARIVTLLATVPPEAL
jgi:hypothetical protein